MAMQMTRAAVCAASSLTVNRIRCVCATCYELPKFMSLEELRYPD